jgi:ubiquinone/menaquinone biosynthesis C-methylase UbiE
MAGDEASVRHPLFARFLEWKAAEMRSRGQAELRDELLGGLSGRILEVGAGTGINFPHYPAGVRELVAVEPEGYLRSRAEESADGLPLDVRVMDGLAGELPFDDGSFDAAVVSFGLCSWA